jgi:SAM-dependent methyltransferase
MADFRTVAARHDHRKRRVFKDPLTMKPSIVDHLACPLCASPLRLDAAPPAAREVLGGSLHCAAPERHTFAIRSGVPELLALDPESRTQQQTVKSFSAKWNKAPEYRKKTERFYIAWYLQRYGFEGLDGLRKFLAGKRLVLEAGTGTGRDSRLYAENSKAQVFGIDISEGIHVAYQDLKGIDNLHLVRADIGRLPFRDEFFDFVACDQVLHHTPDPGASLRQLARVLRRGGHLAFYVYKKKGAVREFCDYYLRAATTEMSEEECYRFSEAVTKLGKALSDLRATVNVPEDIPLLGIKAGPQDVQRFIYWNVFKCFWNDEFDYDTNVIINFDWYHPKDAHRYTEDEVRAMCQALGLCVAHFDVTDSGISVLAEKG